MKVKIEKEELDNLRKSIIELTVEVNALRARNIPKTESQHASEFLRVARENKNEHFMSEALWNKLLQCAVVGNSNCIIDSNKENELYQEVRYLYGQTSFFRDAGYSVFWGVGSSPEYFSIEPSGQTKEMQETQE